MPSICVDDLEDGADANGCAERNDDSWSCRRWVGKQGSGDVDACKCECVCVRVRV